jgi:hypothetical protein
MRASRPCVVFVAIALVAGCHLETMKPSGLAEEHNLTMQGNALRQRVRAMINPFVGALEGTADEAVRRCPGTQLRMVALEWKLQAIPAAQDALLRTDPAVALIDGWAYAVQLRNLFQSERGRETLGACTAEAAANMDKIAQRAREIVGELAGTDASKANEWVERWAKDHPLSSVSTPRANVGGELAEKSARQSLGALAAVGTIVETLDDLVVRIAAYRETLLKEATWTAQLAAMQAVGGDAGERAMRDVERLTLAAERMGVLADRMPAMIEKEREASFAALREERKAILADVDRQRVDTLAAVQRESDAALGRIDKLSHDAIDEGSARAEVVVDHIFLRAAQLIVGLSIIAVLLILAALRIFHVLPVHRRT